jgi:hypothetical protein
VAEVCQVTVTGLQLRHQTAVVTLMSVNWDGRQKAKGPGQQSLCGQVPLSNPYICTCMHDALT